MKIEWDDLCSRERVNLCTVLVSTLSVPASPWRQPTVDFSIFSSVFFASVSLPRLLSNRYWANTFGLEGALHNRGSRFNHSCSPNCTRVLLDGGVARSFITLKPVPEGEELTLSYLPSEMEAMGTAVRRRHLWLSRGFLCRCERCLQPRDDLRQVACPDCASSLPPRTRRREPAWNSKRAGRVAGREEGTPPPFPLPSPPLLLTPPPEPEEVEFADWWNQSGVWVCRRCGWCSDRSGRLHHAEAILSAQVLSLIHI